MFVDTHIHFTHHLFDGEVPCVNSPGNDNPIIRFTRDDLVNYLKNNNFAFCIEPSIEADSYKKILEFSKNSGGFVFSAVGVHPTRTYQADWKERETLSAACDEEYVVAVGELGLDYHLGRLSQHRMIQKRWFLWQINLADEKKLPLILHIRMAHKDAIRILRKNKNKLHGGVCHCFCEGPDTAKIYTEELGLMLGVGGALLNEYGNELADTVKVTPLEYIVLETDGPYVRPEKPQELSGKQWKKARNTSLIIPAVAARIAEIKGISVEEVEQVTTANAKKLFGIV